MSTDLCLYVKRLSIWATTCFSVEDFVIVLPGRGQFQKLLGSTPPLLLFLALCHLCRKGSYVPSSVSTQRSEPSKVLRKLISGIPNSRHQLEARPGYQTRKKAVDSIGQSSHIIPCWQGSKSTTGL